MRASGAKFRMGNERRIFERLRQKVSKTVSFAGNRPIFGKIRLCGITAGSFCLLKGIGCSAGECCMTIATACMAWIAWQGNKQSRENIKIAQASAEAAQKQAEAATEQTKAIQQQIEISQQQAKAAEKQADAAIQSLQEAQKQREEMYRPQLRVYFERENRYSLKLLVKNVGKSPAYHIKVKCEAPWLKRRFKPDSWEYLNSDGAPFYTELRPGQEISLRCLNCLNSGEIGKNYDNFLAVSKTEKYLMEAQPLNITIGYDKNDKNSDEKKDYEKSFVVKPSEATFRHFQFDPEDTKFYSFKDNIMTISVNQEYIKKHIEDHYMDIMKQKDMTMEYYLR